MKRLILITVAITLFLPLSAQSAPKKPKYEAVEVTNGGSIKGVIKTSIKVVDPVIPIHIKPKENPLETEQEKKTCGENHGAMMYLISSSGGVKNAMVFVEGVKKGKAAPKKDLIINNNGCRFEPLVGIAYLKSNFVFKNSDPLFHNTSIGKMLPSGVRRTVYNLALPHKDQVITKPDRVSGLLHVKCDAHPWMRAYVYSSRHPYVAITGDNGEFEINDLLPGKYTVRIWHEGFKEMVREVDVQAGKTASLDGAFSETITPAVLNK
jgi:hypothetical protein